MACNLLEGQMNLFEMMELNTSKTDKLDENQEETEAEIKIATLKLETEKTLLPNLVHGDKMYLCIRGEIEEYLATGEFWKYNSEDYLIYQLIQIHGNGYASTNDRELGVRCFRNRNKAELVSKQYRAGKDIIYASDMQPLSIESYSYIRTCDGRKMTTFCAELGKYLYIKEFMTYHHLVENTPKNRKKFRTQKEFEYCEVKSELWIPEMETGFKPNLKNMYRCRGGNTDWLYAEARYALANG